MFPKVPPPPNDIGALSFPRQLQRWLDDNPVTPLTRISTFIQLPKFNQGSNTWNGLSDIVAAFNFESQYGFSLKTFTPPVNPNYTLCISYHTGAVMVRYSLWRATGDVLPYGVIPYNGQGIQKNFRLEVWNTSQGTASDNNGFIFYTGKLGPIDYRWGQDTTLVGADAEVTNFKANDNGLSLPQSVTVSGAGTAGINGIYVLTGPASTNPPYYDWVMTTNNNNIIQLNLIAGQWQIGSGFSPSYASPDVNTMDPTMISDWSAINSGTPPAPTTTQTPLTTYTNIFNLPLTFPANSTSVTN